MLKFLPAHVFCAFVFLSPQLAHSQNADLPAGHGGSDSTFINGKSALRSGDVTGAEAGAGDASPNVMINGKPAAAGGKCPGGQPPTPSPNVMIDGKPALLCGG